MPKKSTESTRERILKAAERIYAASGFHGMSLRDVTVLAGVNLAAVNYHFGSKDKLILALADRRLTPINNDRLARLDRLREQGTRPFAQDLGELVLEGSWLNQSDDVIVGHGISLLRWRSEVVKQPHDMPPSRFPPSPTSAHSSVEQRVFRLTLS